MLDEKTLRLASDELAQRDSHLQAIITKHGYPPLWAREPGFPTLVKIILEQQVSLSSAQAAYDKLLARINPLTPEQFLTLDDAELKQVGFQQTENPVLSYSRGDNQVRGTGPTPTDPVKRR